MTVSGYDKFDKLIEGKLTKNSKNENVVLTETGSVLLKDINYTRFIEEDEDKDVAAKVEDDLNHCDDEKLKNTSDDELKKAGDDREKELQDAGMDIDDGEYSTQFQAAAKAKVQLDDVEAGNISQSKALEKVVESTEDNDYNDVTPYQDKKSKDEIYLDIKNELNNMKNTDDAKTENKIAEHLLGKFTNNKVSKKDTLKETLISIVDYIYNK